MKHLKERRWIYIQVLIQQLRIGCWMLSSTTSEVVYSYPSSMWPWSYSPKPCWKDLKLLCFWPVASLLHVDIHSDAQNIFTWAIGKTFWARLGCFHHTPWLTVPNLFAAQPLQKWLGLKQKMFQPWNKIQYHKIFHLQSTLRDNLLNPCLFSAYSKSYSPKPC